MYVCLDADCNGGGHARPVDFVRPVAACRSGSVARAVARGHDPASFFAAGASAQDFRRCLEDARP